MTVPDPALEPVWSWLHVSDIHAGHGDAAWIADQRLVLSALLEDAREQVESGAVPRPDALLVTGDVGTTGAVRESTEYDLSAEFLVALRDAVRATDVYCVPGNHDIARSLPSSRAAHRLLERLRDGTEDLDGALADNDDNGVLTGRLSAYSKFADANCPRLALGAGLSWSTRLPARDGSSVRIVGLNSSLLCNDDGDERLLRIGRVQLAEQLADPSYRDETVLVLTHHPLSWLAPSDASEATGWITKKADVHMHGHLHVLGTGSRVSGDGQGLVTVQAGAAHADRGTGSGRPPHGYSFCALYPGPDVGHLGLRVWPRRMTATGTPRFVVDVESVPNGSACADHALAGRSARPVRSAQPGNALAELAQRLLDRLGQRRTAYPTDATVASLAERDLLVPPLFSRVDSTSTSLSLPEVADTARYGRVLILGSPGSGKTVTSYLVARAATASGSVVPIVVDAAQLVAVAGEPRALVAAVATANRTPAPSLDAPVMWIVDGVDETLAAGTEPAEIAAALRALGSVGGLLVTCRAADYQRRLMAVLGDVFSELLEVRDWTVAGEFADFIRRLEVNGDDTALALMTRVESDAALQALIARPLFARMLVLVGDAHITDRAGLYQQYIGRLAAATETALARVGCSDAAPVGVRWRDLAWDVFRTGKRADRIPLPEASAAVGPLTPECAHRVLSGIADVVAADGELTASFVHYSFYEFLVARYAADGLMAAFPADPAAAAGFLARDLPQEIRRFLVQILRARAADLPSWPGWLAKVYAASEGGTAAGLTARNLVAYISCRLDVPAAAALEPLLTEERDPFLRNSLYWALARCGDNAATDAYIAELATDDELAALNRGYLLYYFGDLPRADPPFRDDQSHRPWPQTRQKLGEKAAGVAQNSEGAVPARLAVDLHTWFELAAVRGEHLDGAEAAAASKAIEVLRSSAIPRTALQVVEDGFAAVAPT